MASRRGWAAWILLFLLMEIPAAADGKKGGTLSETVWETFRPRWSRALLLVFLACLTCHLVLGSPSGLWIILTGTPVGMFILYNWLIPKRPKCKQDHGCWCDQHYKGHR